ncbi:hypothetical protein VSR69_38555 [Paraburkholderia phytofirmans]
MNDRQKKRCMLVNSALEMAPHDAEFQKTIAGVLVRIEEFFLGCVTVGQADGTIAQSLPAEVLARHLVGVLMGVRILARVRPEKALLEGVIRTSACPAFAIAGLRERQVISSSLPGGKRRIARAQLLLAQSLLGDWREITNVRPKRPVQKGCTARLKMFQQISAQASLRNAS